MHRLLLTAFCLAMPPLATAATHAPAARPTPGPGDAPVVIGFGHDLTSRVLGGVRRVNVHLPEHAGEPGHHPPVLVLLDGGVKEDFVHIAGLADITAAYGQGREVVVVGVEGVDRRHDLTTPSSVAADREVAPTSGSAVAYRRFLVSELRPWIDAMWPDHGRVAIMGESLAGLFVVQTLLEEPAAFDDYISVSPSLWWDGGRLARTATDALRRSPPAGRRLWLAFERPAPPAVEAIRERALQEKLASALRTAAPKGLWWRTVQMEEGHASVYHPAAMRALRALYGVGKGS